jgi:hypothetical protein
MKPESINLKVKIGNFVSEDMSDIMSDVKSDVSYVMSNIISHNETINLMHMCVLVSVLVRIRQKSTKPQLRQDWRQLVVHVYLMLFTALRCF